MEPEPGNVSGEKVEKVVQKHAFTHHIRWGYVALGVAGVVVVLFLTREFGESSKNEDDGI